MHSNAWLGSKFKTNQGWKTLSQKVCVWGAINKMNINNKEKLTRVIF